MQTPVRRASWSKSYELGFDILDCDHKNLVEIVNRVARAIESGDLGKTLALMHHFADTARAHFTQEEALLRDSGFRNLERHVTYHERLLSNADTIMRSCEATRDLVCTRECFESLVDCLLDDVIRGDMEFKAHLSAIQT